MITQLELGGAQDNTLTTVKQLPKDRYETHLVCGRGGMLDAQAKLELGDRCHFIDSLVRPIDPIHDLQALNELRTHFKNQRYDIVHTHSSKAGILGRLAARLAGVPLIIHTAHGWGFHAGQTPMVRKIFTFAERIAAGWTDKLVGVSAATIQKGLDAGVGKADQYVLIRSGIHPEPFRVPSEKSKGPVVATIACFKPQKSPLDVIDVADAVRGKIPEVKFVLAGDGELRGAMEREISRRNLAGVVRLLGWSNDVPGILKSSDLLLLTSRWEGLPRVFLEASAAGVPVIATNVDGAPEAVSDGVNGYLFNPGDTRSMADKIIEIFQKPALLEKLRAGAKASWREEFDIRNMVQKIDELYQNP